MTNILMVCLGNICRSPLAEGIFKKNLDDRLFNIDSAGTGAWHTGELPDKRSIAVAFEHGIDITNQRARQFKISDFERFDYIFVMDKSNLNDVLDLARTDEDKNKVKLILNLIEKNNLEVPDPYYGGTNGFNRVYKMLYQSCIAFKEQYK